MKNILKRFFKLFAPRKKANLVPVFAVLDSRNQNTKYHG